MAGGRYVPGLYFSGPMRYIRFVRNDPDLELGGTMKAPLYGLSTMPAAPAPSPLMLAIQTAQLTILYREEK